MYYNKGIFIFQANYYNPFWLKTKYSKMDYGIFQIEVKIMNRLKEIREDKDYTQEYISKYLNMSQTGYSKYECGERDIPTEVLKKLAKLYNTSIDYLLYMTDERLPYKKSIMLEEMLEKIVVSGHNYKSDSK